MRFTYDQNTIADGSYAASYAGYLGNPANLKEGSELTKHEDNSWRATMASYRETYSRVEKTECKDVYISHDGDKRYLVARIQATLWRNQMEPGDLEWSDIHQFDESYAVYFDDRGVFDVKRQESNLIPDSTS